MTPRIRRINAFIGVFLIIVSLLAFTQVVSAAPTTPNDWICQVVSFNYSQHGELAKWNGSTWTAYGHEYPLDMFEIEIDILYAMPIGDNETTEEIENAPRTDGPAYVIFYSAEYHELWIFAFTDLIDGPAPGMHHICSNSPHVYSLGASK